MSVNSNPLECFLCWKPLNDSQTLTTDAEVLSKFEFSKQQTDNCKKYLKSDIISKCGEQNIKINGWEWENFCSTCFETSETLTVLIEVLEETKRELNLIVDQFNEQILNERCKKLNSSLPVTIDSDIGDLSDGFSGDDFLNNEEYDAPKDCSTTSNASGRDVSKESNQRAFEPKSAKENDQLHPTRSKKRKLENKNQGKSSNKSNKLFPRIILEKMSDGVAEIMQEKLIERLISDGIISERPPNTTKHLDFGRRETELRDENNLFVVKPVFNESKDAINGNVDIKHELCDFDNESFQNDEEAETIEISNEENIGSKNQNNPLNSSKDLRITLSRIQFAKGRMKKFPITSVSPQVAKTTTKVKQNAINISKNMLAEGEINNVQSECQNGCLESDTPLHHTIVTDVLDGDKTEGQMLQYKCETCEFIAASFGELFQHKKTHNPNQPLKCTWCSKQFKKEISFFTHMRYHTVNSSDLFHHTKKPLKIFKSDYYKCNLCRKRFKSIYVLQEHRRTEHRKTEQVKIKHGKTKHVETEPGKIEPEKTEHVETEPQKTEHRIKRQKASVEFVCKITGKIFKLSRNRQGNVIMKPFKCGGCKLSFTTSERLAFHQGKQEGDEKSKAVFYECKVCGNIYTLERILKCHMRIHTGVKPFKCNDCGKCFRVGRVYKNHLKIHISTFDFVCERENCGQKFKIIQELNEHKRNHNRQDHLTENDKGKYYQCPECDKKFKKRFSKEFVRHMRSHELKFDCSICEKKFISKIARNEHIMAEHGNRFPCTLCSQTFSFKGGLTSHINIMHVESDAHVCEDCGASYKRISRLNSHRKAKHSEETEPTIKCDNCDRKFFSMEQLRTHKRGTHNYQQCEVCGLTVRLLNVHMLGHNTVPFECDICGKKFKRKMALGTHKRVIHEGQQKECKHCGRKFNRATNLMVHVRTHTGDKPYECSTCGKRFDRKHNLTTHMRFHTGEKPYKCDKCGNQFSRKDNLNTHVKKCSF